jgi:ABC-type lipoprotein release transport system permease subunit
MTAITMLVRKAWRRHWRASIFLAVVAGLAASVVGASFQAAARSDTSLARFTEQSRIYDFMVQGCPPGVDYRNIDGESELIERCLNPELTARFRRVLDRVKGVERTGEASTSVVALLDPSVSNHWGRLTLVAGIWSSDSPAPPLRPIVVRGRMFDPGAADEIMVTEAAARVARLHVGDAVRIASWHQVDLDAAVDGKVAPQTPVFTSKVVGIARGLEDVQADGSGSLSDAVIPGNIGLLAGPAWAAAHGAGMPGYGAGVLVRLRGGASSAKSFDAELSRAPHGWHGQASRISEVDPTSVRRVIDLERRALLVFASIAIVAGLVFVGLSAVRQLRRESSESQPLLALGMTRRELRVLNVVRALTIAIPACVIAVVGIVTLSPAGPLGLARRLEFHLSVRVDGAVLASTVAVVLIVFALAGAVTPVDTRSGRRARVRSRASRLNPALLGMGPVAATAATVARGRSSRAAVAVTAIAVAAGVAAGGLVASFDRLLAKPERYGASWDIVVGQYSQPGPLASGVAKLRANPEVAAAAGFYEQTDAAKVDGQSTVVLALRDYISHRDPVMAAGRAPSDDSEVALGRETARKIHKGIGDEVNVSWGTEKGPEVAHLRVVGILVVNDPISSQAGAGSGIFVTPPVFAAINGPNRVAQSVVIKLDPRHDRAAAIESVRRDFSGSIREAIPPVDARNLGHLRAVPWLIAGLIGILALATLIHALVTMLSRNRTTLAVLAALGFTRAQRRGVGMFASVALVTLGVAIGIPLGLVIGARVWTTVADGIDLPSASSPAWSAILLAGAGALGVAALVARTATRGSVRMTPSEQLRVE